MDADPATPHTIPHTLSHSVIEPLIIPIVKKILFDAIFRIGGKHIVSTTRVKY
jgi:hypothetical protein